MINKILKKIYDIDFDRLFETHPFHIGMLFPVGLSMTGLLVISIIV